MFENIGSNTLITNACALSSGLLLGFMIKNWFKNETIEDRQNNNAVRNDSSEQVCFNLQENFISIIVTSMPFFCFVLFCYA